MSSSRFSSRLVVFCAGLLLLCAGLSALVWWFSSPPSLPEPAKPVVAAKPPPAKPVVKSSPPPAPVKVAPPDRSAIDPDVQRLADDLAARQQTPVRDLEIVNEFVTMYSKAFQGNPIGGNEDITAVLTGHSYHKGVLFPPDSPMIVKGQIVDRWGTPYWFHPSSGTHMEIRSAGPDKSLFTTDDVIINPSPESIGGGVAAAP